LSIRYTNRKDVKLPYILKATKVLNYKKTQAGYLIVYSFETCGGERDFLSSIPTQAEPGTHPVFSTMSTMTLFWG
jgi:hypothetical protein